MDLLKGLKYNLKGLLVGLKTPKLLFLGMARLLLVVLFAVALSGVVLYWHQELLNLVWAMPESNWLVVLWKMVSWLVSLLLILVSGVFSYLLAQLVFALFIMDFMSRITEKMVTGGEQSAWQSGLPALVLFLLKQEIPRVILPMAFLAAVTVAGFFTPFGPLVAVVSSAAAAAILAWDNTDLIPARRMVPFRQRFLFFRQHILFHVGFGLWFLVPWLNILFLSFAPVGGALYYLETEKKRLDC